MFVVERPEELQALLGEAADNDPNLEMFYTLEQSEAVAISRHFNVPFEADDRTTSLYQFAGLGETPYLIHTGYELALLLDGRKKFARMGEEYPPERHQNEDRFDHYVALGLLHKEVDFQKFDLPVYLKNGRTFAGVRTVYYTRKGEEWRVPAWRLIERASRKSGWNEHFERLEGMLFGYEDWQNDWWIENLRKKQRQFGTSLLYLAVSARELTGIESNGWRALPAMARSLEIVSSFSEEPDDEEPRRLMDGTEAVALVRFRVKTRPFLDLVDAPQKRVRIFPASHIKDLNRLIVDDIEIVMRRDSR